MTSMTNERRSFSWMFRGALSNLCPNCGKAPVFRGFSMAKDCPVCHFKYEREHGYYMGAMVLSYVFSSFSVIPTFIIGVMLLNANVFAVIAVASLQIILLVPFLLKYSRLIWIYLDHRQDPSSS